MRRLRRLWIPFTSVVVALSILTFYVSRDNERRYNGQTLRSLLYNAAHTREFRPEVAFATRHSGYFPSAAAEAAVRQVGTNALPELVLMLSYDPHPIRTKLLNAAARARMTQIGRLIPASVAVDRRAENAELALLGFRLLGPVASPAIPDLERLAGPKHSPAVIKRAIDALYGIGPAALPALTSLSTNLPARHDAAMAIMMIGATGVPITEELAAIAEPGDSTAGMAVSALRIFPATNAVPILTGLLSHPKSRVRKAAAGTLMDFSSRARSAIPALYATVNDVDVDVRQQGLRTLHYLAPEMFVTNSTPRLPISK